jgi:hypothetical protein
VGSSTKFGELTANGRRFQSLGSKVIRTRIAKLKRDLQLLKRRRAAAALVKQVKLERDILSVGAANCTQNSGGMPTATPTAAPTLTPPPDQECSDGIDNDGDGLIDMEDNSAANGGIALGCQGPNWSETATSHDGYTMFNPSSDTRILYVSNTYGNDSFDGLYPRPIAGTSHGPYKTTTFGTRMMRNRHGYPDWLLVDRCDDYPDQYFGGYFSTSQGEIYGSWNFSGRSASEPMVLGTYGTCVRRPRILHNGGVGAIYVHDNNGYLAITGLELNSYKRDPLDPGFEVGAPSTFGIYIALGAHDVLIEDNLVRNSIVNINLNSQCPLNSATVDPYDFSCPPNIVRSIAIRKNVIVDGWHGQGIFSSNVKDLLIEGNVVDHNGWSEHPATGSGGEATIYNHNMYLSHGYQGSTTVSDNVVANGSATGIQLRVQGSITGNLVLKNPLGITLGHDQVTENFLSSGVISDNVVLDARDISNLPRGFGIATGRADGVEISRNIVAHQRSGSSNIYGIDVGHPSLPTSNVSLTRNIVYDWSNDGGGEGVTLHLFGPHTNLTVDQNDFQQFAKTPGGGVLYAANLLGMTFSANRYFSSGRILYAAFQGERVIDVGSQALTIPEFLALTSDQTSTATQACYVDPSRDTAAYMAHLGKPATYDSYIQSARQMFRPVLAREFTAPVVNQYIRDGFAPCN